jgi:PAS domain S-box-containing protein
MTSKPTYEQLEKGVQELEQAELESKQHAEDLKKYRNIISSTQEGVAFLNRDYRYIIVNDAYEKFSGVDREHFLGLTVSEYLGKEVFERSIKPNLDRCLQGEIVNYQEWFNYR